MIKVQRMSFSSINDILHTTTLETLNYFRRVYLNLKHTRIANTKTSLLVCANRAGSLVFTCKFHGFKSLLCEIRTAYSFMFTHALRYPYTPIITKWNCFSLWFAVLVVPRSCYYNDNRPWRGCEEQFESESFLSIYCYHTGYPESTNAAKTNWPESFLVTF